MTEQAPSRPASPLVVGIGASAGGLDSLDRFFRGLPAQPGVVIVIVQHLSPNHESLMEELLQRFTALAVHRAEDRLEVEANHVYVLPPGKEITLSGRQLRVTDRPGERMLSFPIDRFFTSLAEECGRRAVAVVLSGGGTDGSRGVRSIHEAGGLVLVEDPAGAAFESMPRSAIETGITDAVLSPRRLRARCSITPRAAICPTATRRRWSTRSSSCCGSIAGSSWPTTSPARSIGA
jgi:two-component system CheB/CheR fusion protein